MPKRQGKSTNGEPISKMDAVRQVLAADSNAKAREISDQVKAKFGIDLDPKMAATYRYHIKSKSRRKQRRAVRAVQAKSPAASDTGHGVDDLLRAASKLGWQRINEIVQGVLTAPS